MNRDDLKWTKSVVGAGKPSCAKLWNDITSLRSTKSDIAGMDPSREHLKANIDKPELTKLRNNDIKPMCRKSSIINGNSEHVKDRIDETMPICTQSRAATIGFDRAKKRANGVELEVPRSIANATALKRAKILRGKRNPK